MTAEAVLATPTNVPLNCVLAVMKLAVTAVPETFPDKKPVNWVFAVTKLAVTAVPERLPLWKPLI